MCDFYSTQKIEKAKIAQESVDVNGKLQQKLEKIKEIVLEPCIEGENCATCKSGCMQKDILQIIDGEINERI